MLVDPSVPESSQHLGLYYWQPSLTTYTISKAIVGQLINRDKNSFAMKYQNPSSNNHVMTHDGQVKYCGAILRKLPVDIEYLEKFTRIPQIPNSLKENSH